MREEMLPRVLEPEVMDTREEAVEYDTMDHSEVNRAFVADFLRDFAGSGSILDVGTGTAQIPIELCRQSSVDRVVAVDLAEEMLRVGRVNVESAGLEGRIELRLTDAKRLPFTSGAFAAVISNSIVHHIPEPSVVVAEMVRVAAAGGFLFVRDLLRPEDDATVRQLVQAYAADANARQRELFENSLRAALTVEEMRQIVRGQGIDPATVRQSSDRHWTWSVRK